MLVGAAVRKEKKLASVKFMHTSCSHGSQLSSDGVCAIQYCIRPGCLLYYECHACVDQHSTAIAALPACTAWCEHGSSTQNRLKTKLRNWLLEG